jgi:Glycosyltransferase family 87
LLTYILLALVASIIYLYASIIVSKGLHDHALLADYTGFLLGSAMFAQGHANASDLYSIPIQTTVQQQLLVGSSVHFPDGLLPFVNPPYVAMLAIPLYYLPPDVGFILWDGLQLAALLLSLWLLQPMLPSNHRHLLWLGAFTFLPVYQSLVEGQISPTLLLAITLLWRSLRTGPSADWWAGASLAILLLKPQLLPPYLLYLLYRRNWRALGSFAAISFVVYLLSALPSGLRWPLAYLDLLGRLSSYPGHYGSLPSVMLNWRGLLVRLHADGAPLLLALTALTIAALVYAWWRSDTPAKLAASERVGKIELQLAATTIAAALTSFYLYPHDLTILLFSCAALLGWAAQGGWPNWLSAVLLINLFSPLLALYWQPVDLLFVMAIIVAFAALLYLLVQRRAATPRVPSATLLPLAAVPRLAASGRS